MSQTNKFDINKPYCITELDVKNWSQDVEQLSRDLENGPWTAKMLPIPENLAKFLENFAK